jgi:hypothetical protein
MGQNRPNCCIRLKSVYPLIANMDVIARSGSDLPWPTRPMLSIPEARPGCGDVHPIAGR